MNRYSYTRNNPLKYTDPSGHWVETAFDAISLGMTLNDIRNEGLTFWNAVSLVTDVASVALPIVPAAASHAIRAGKLASKAINAADTAADAAKLLNAADVAGDAAKLANKADDVADATKPLIQKGIYEFDDLLNPGQKYVGQSGDIPQRLQQHVSAGRLDQIQDAKVTQVSGGKFTREIAEQDRISQLGGIPGGKLSNKINPIGVSREAAARAQGLKHPIPR